MIETPASPVLAAALRWIKRGAAPIPVRYGEKVPVGEAWQKQRLTAGDVSSIFNCTPLNLGILWGEPSSNVVDVDLDWSEACAIAPALLPASAIYGRKSNVGSHWLFEVPSAVTRQWTLSKTLVPEGRKEVVLELRADGTQSVVPPSTHPGGEFYEWGRERKPHAIEHAVLLRKLNLIASGAILVQFWREGVRHRIALALSGAALSAGYTVDEIVVLVTAVAEAAGDPEARDRAAAVHTSARVLTAGKPATGIPRLAELVGEPAVAVLKKWLGLGAAVPLVNGAPAPATSALPGSGAEGVLTVRNASTIEEVPMKWLWPNRIARGKLHVVAGEPGLSKSVLTCAIAGIVTNGGEWPLDRTRCAVGDALMLNVEDDPADTIRPRLRAAGANLARVELIEGVRGGDGRQRGMTLADVGLLEQYLVQHPGRFALLTCDPIGALMADRDTHRDSDVRSLLAPLATLAMRHDLAIVLVAHLNKATGMAALHRIVGSIGFSAAARMVYFLARDPDDDKRVLLVPGKANLAPMGMAGISYELESADLGGGIVAPRIRWHDVPEMRSANEVLSPTRPAAEQSDAEAWVRDRLTGGPVLVRVLQEEAKLKVDASWRTIERAARKLGVVGTGEHRARTWELPSAAEAFRQNDIPTSRQELVVLSDCPPTEQSDTAPDSWRDVGMSECRDAAVVVDQAVELLRAKRKPIRDVSPAAVATFLASASLVLDEPTVGPLHPCTDCAKLNVGGYCSHYRRVMPEPETPNACVRYEPQLLDTPWE